ncbi:MULTISPECIES: amino acid ABC transporter permease [unclassified Lebetimonas]|jgi:His/Glu/Gln/Arg/opine family amino acid ABC transporter permease subunit|uniref:amino acid ABC transporter permease n=1 Tax=unclassified Lebetimonas TaxID=2648158 RepID=UPI000464B039|nr:MULTISPECIES: amino acid ABC transporter permease [unclassified Lebetimonas]
MGYEFDWHVLIEYKQLLINGLITTIKLSVLGIFFSFIIGSIVGIGRASKSFWLSLISSYYVESFRNIPLIVQMFFIYFTFTLSQIFPFLNTWGDFLHINDVDAFFSALLALILYTGAYIAEVVKAGIRSIPKGQFEAARSLGMNRFQVMWYVIYPQAVRIIIPPLTSQFLNLIKNSSLAMTIGVAELTFSTQQIDAETFRGFEAATAVTILYIILTLSTSFIMNLIEIKFSKGVKNA